MPEDFEGDENPSELDKPPSFFPYGAEEDEQAVDANELIEVDVEGVFQAETNGQVNNFVLLTDGVRKLPILIGQFECHSILLCLEEKLPDRPLTHDLMKTVLDKITMDLDHVVIDDIFGGTYYAKLHLTGKSQDLIIDARPSDAIALALRFDAPIFVVPTVFETEAEG